MDPVKLEIILQAPVTLNKPIKFLNYKEKITAVGEKGMFWVIEMDGKRVYVEKGRTIKI